MAVHQASLSFTVSGSLLKLMSIELMMPTNHLILCHFLHLMSSVFPNIRVFSSELALHIRWPKYWSFSFSFSICPSNEYSGLISYRIDWFDSRIEPTSPALQADFLHSEPPGKPLLLLKLSCTCTKIQNQNKLVPKYKTKINNLAISLGTESFLLVLFVSVYFPTHHLLFLITLMLQDALIFK